MQPSMFFGVFLLYHPMKTVKPVNFCITHPFKESSSRQDMLEAELQPKREI